MPRRVGAPKGGRVHWFLLNLPCYVTENYRCSFDYEKHAYFLFRRCAQISKGNFAISDFYTIVRTSRRCWRVTAHDMVSKETVYKSAQTSAGAGKIVAEYARKWHDDRPWTSDRQVIL